MPIITRLHTPHTLGEFQFFTTVALLLAPLMSGSFAIAIKSSKNRYQSYLYLKAGIFYTVFFLFILIAISPIILILINESGVSWFSEYYFLLIFFVFLSCNFQFAISIMINLKKYKEQSVLEVKKSIVFNSLKLMLSYYSKTAFSLVYALVISEFIQLLLVLRKNIFLLKRIILLSKKINLKKEFNILRKYPTYVTFSNIISIFFNWFPILIAGYFYGSYNIGLLSLAFTVVNTPIYPFITILQSICFGELSRGGINKKSIKIYKKIFIIALIPSVFGLIVLHSFGEVLFSFVFGDVWYKAGSYAFYCFIPVSISMIFLPFYSTLNQILGLQKTFFKVQVGLLILMIGVFFILLYNNLNFDFFIIFYSSSMVIVHILLFLISLISLRFFLVAK